MEDASALAPSTTNRTGAVIVAAQRICATNCKGKLHLRSDQDLRRVQNLQRRCGNALLQIRSTFEIINGTLRYMTETRTLPERADFIEAVADNGHDSYDGGHDTHDDASEPVGDERRRAILAETDRYLSELKAELGEPSPESVARAEALCDRIERHLGRTETAGWAE